ncbi:copper-binding protein [Ramlibacter sp. H39-3-26]|uniref:copper-binding protein n=1 Tax=Curvibacter soli TaxID=3031331 RepID=UPI0023DBC3D5|nr:copper-binding protein [Ramlibacter sp. H39-3-26]MDF1484144.1 copper-binding protein [Ramlibacter sp. H39-3-26]
MKQLRLAIAASVAALTFSFAGISGAQSATDATTSAATAGEMTDGEVRKVDKENKKLTIKHGPLKSLDMPGMTMVFQVQDPALVETVQPGDKVRFVAEKLDGKFTVTKLEVAR